MILMTLMVLAAAADGSGTKASPPSIISGVPTDADYPAEARRNREQGTTRYRLEVDERGRTTGCTVTDSSGSRSLDAAGRRVFIAKTLWLPGKDTEGRAVPSSYTVPVRWQMPKPDPVKSGTITFSARRGPDGQPIECQIVALGSAPKPPSALNRCAPWSGEKAGGGFTDLAVFFREHRTGEDLRFVTTQEQAEYNGTLPPPLNGQIQQVALIRNEETLACATMMDGSGPLFVSRPFNDCSSAKDVADIEQAAGEGLRRLFVTTLRVLPNTPPPTPSD